MNIIKSLALYPSLLLFLAGAAQADTVTFAQFTETSAGGNSATFTNTGSTATLSISEPVLFQYVGLGVYTGLPQTEQAATLVLTATSTTPAQTAFGVVDLQSNFYGSFSFLTSSNVNLLSGTFGPSGGGGASFLALQGAGSGGFSTSADPNAVTFTSSYLTFVNTPNGENFGLSFSSLEPSVNFSHGKISPFTAAVTGTFASDPAPVGPFNTPEPASIASLSLGLAGLAVFKRRRT